MKQHAPMGLFVAAILLPVVLIASGGDPRGLWGELRRVFSGGLVAEAALMNTMPMPFGGDDTGYFVPLDKNTLKCENTVAKNVSKLMDCIIKCHMKAANEAVKTGNTSDDEPCEQACRAKYDKSSSKLLALGICPACLDAPHQATLADQAETTLDATNQGFYCAH